MPRCCIKKVKLVAEAELPILPFLAPRVFQPWPFPRKSTRSHSTSVLGGKSQTGHVESSEGVSSPKIRPTFSCQALKPQARCFSTHANTRDWTRSDTRPRRQRDAPKVQNSRGQVAQDWYENALAGLEERLVDQHDQSRRKKGTNPAQQGDDKTSIQEVAKDTRAQRLAQARQLERRTESSRKSMQLNTARKHQPSFFLDKARRTADLARLPLIRTKWVQVGHPVRRRRPESEGADSGTTPADNGVVGPGLERAEDELRYVISEQALKWNYFLARLGRKYDIDVEPSPTFKRRVKHDERSKQWADQLLSFDDTSLQDPASTMHGSIGSVELEAQSGLSWNEIWFKTMLYLLDERSDDAIRFLEITWRRPELPIPPLPWIMDSLQYLVSHCSEREGKDAAEAVTVRHTIATLLCNILETPDSPVFNIPGGVVRPLLQHSAQEQCVRVFEGIKRNGSVLHWNTWLHFATSLARFDCFDQALDALLEAASAGADTRSSQFESNCATILRKAADQSDGLRVSLRMVQNMSDIGVKLNVQLCNSVMLNAVESGDLKTAFSIYHSLVEHGLEADKYTHAILLKGCKFDIHDSETLNSTIRQAISDTEISTSDVVATEILHCLYLHHFELNPQTAFNTVAEAYAQLFDTSALVEMRILPERSQKTQLMQPTMAALHIMITAYLRRSTRQTPSYVINDTHQLYRHMRMLVSRNIEPWTQLATTDHIANAFLLFFTSHASALSHAAEIVRDMQQAPPTPPDGTTILTLCKPTVRTWSIFLQGFARHGKMDLAEQVLTYMREKNIQPNQVTWNSLLGGYASARDVDGAVSAFERMRKEGFEGDDVTTKAFGRIREGQGAMERLSQAGSVGAAQDMRERGGDNLGVIGQDGQKDEDGFWDTDLDEGEGKTG